jgi:hypothetical protein
LNKDDRTRGDSKVKGKLGKGPSKDLAQENSFIHNAKIKDIFMHNLNELDFVKSKNRKMVTKEELVKKLVLVKKKLKKDRKEYLKFQIQDVSRNKTSKIIKLLIYLVFIYIFLSFAIKLNNVEDVFYINNGISSAINSDASNKKEDLTYFFENHHNEDSHSEFDQLSEVFNVFNVKTLNDIKLFFLRTLDFFESKEDNIYINKFTNVLDKKAIRYAVKQIKLPQTFLDPKTEDRFRMYEMNVDETENHLLLRIYVFPPEKKIFNYFNNSYKLNNDNYFKNDLGKYDLVKKSLIFRQ